MPRKTLMVNIEIPRSDFYFFFRSWHEDTSKEIRRIVTFCIVKAKAIERCKSLEYDLVQLFLTLRLVSYVKFNFFLFQ